MSFSPQTAPATQHRHQDLQMSVRPPVSHSVSSDKRVTVLDCPFDTVTFDQAVERIVGWCHSGTGARTVVTMNAALLVMLRKDPELAVACRAGDLIVPDGVPVVWASSLIKTPLTGRVAGVDLMQALLQRASTERLSVYFLGAKQEVLDRLAQICAEHYPGIRLAGSRNGYFGAADHEQVVSDIRRSGADLLFIGMPSPFKEVFAERYRHDLNVPVIMGVGGSFDVLAGFVRRAPESWQRAGFEWAWRLRMEPRKLWRRYLVTNTLFLARVARDAVKSRF